MSVRSKCVWYQEESEADDEHEVNEVFEAVRSVR